MQKIKILNNKEIKEILNLIEKQWDAKLNLDYVFLKTEKEKIYIVNKDISKVDLGKLRINTIGLYFAEVKDNNIRLSIEGSQIIGPKAKKNVLELNEKEVKEWMRGNDLERLSFHQPQDGGKTNLEKMREHFDKETNLSGFLIIKDKDDYLGCGKRRDGEVLNFIGKARRINPF